MTRLILCADDYGLSPAVSRGIRRLLEAGRLSATSCMAVSPHWPGEAAALRPYGGRADIGLHLTLTDQAPLGPMPRLAATGRLPSLTRLMALALARRLEPLEIRAEIERQIAAFEAAMGRPPDFIDGHQHVQQLPQIRDVVVEVMRRSLAGSTWLRACDEPAAAIIRRGIAVPKALVIAAFGRRLRQKARAAGIAVNDRFTGVHDFSGGRPYAELFARFVDGVDGGRLVVMCHPGEIDDELRARDSVAEPRLEELSYFASPAFAELLARRGLSVQRFAG